MEILGEYKSFWPGESSSPEVDKSRDVLHTYGVLPSPKNWLVTDLDCRKRTTSPSLTHARISLTIFTLFISDRRLCAQAMRRKRPFRTGRPLPI